MLKAKAFSLIEVLVVITIIGIITVISAPNYAQYNQKANLENTTKLFQSDLYEAFSLSRSRGKHFQVVGIKDQNFIEILACDDLSCSASTSHDRFEFLGKNTIKSSDFRVQFNAPLGDITFPDDPSDPQELELKIGDDNNERSLKIYQKSGLIQLPKP